MESARFLYSKSVSPCCRQRAILVRSREGGFVSQNCLKCGLPDYVRDTELPDLRCDFCRRALIVRKSDGTNYHYVCEHCSRTWKLADVLPSWSELFEYSGLAAYGDPLAEL